MRILLLLGLLAAAGAGDWTGVIEIDDVLIAPAADADDRRELDDYLRQLLPRLERVRERRASATAGHQIHAQDEAFLVAEIQQAAIARGGEVRIGTTRLWVRGERIRAEGDGLVIADRARDAAWVRGPGGFAAMPLEPAPTATTAPLRLADGRLLAVRASATTPNAFALLTLPRDTAPIGELAWTLAPLPTLPEQIDIPGSPGQPARRLMITARPGPVDEALVAAPR